MSIMHKAPPVKKSTYLFAGIIFFLALLPRIILLDYVEFKEDEALNVFLATRVVFGHLPPVMSTVSSLGVPNFPLFTYLLIPFTFVSSDPRFLSGVIALLNVIAITFLFFVLRKFFGTSIALLTGIFLSLSPWAILYSRKIWTPDIILPFMVVWIFCILQILLQKKISYWFAYCAVSLFLIQLHYSSLFLIIPATVVLLKNKKPPFSKVVWGLTLGVIPAIPFIVYEVLLNCPDCNTLTNLTSQLTHHSPFSYFLKPFQITGVGQFHTILGEDYATFFNDYRVIFELKKVLYIFYILLPIGMILFYKLFPKVRILLLISIGIPILYLALNIDPLMHYYVMLLPLLFLFISTGIVWIIKKNNVGKICGITVISLILITFILFNFAFFTLVYKGYGLKGEYGKAYIVHKKRIQESLTKFNNSPHYKEMAATLPVSKQHMLGFHPIPKMLFTYSAIRSNIRELDNKVKSTPPDPRALLQLFYFYSYPEIPHKHKLREMREKAKTYSGYNELYNSLYEIYLSQNLKKHLSNQALSIRLEYPQHWKVIKNSQDGIELSHDTFTLFITNKFSDFEVLADQIIDEKQLPRSKKNVCRNRDFVWCGTQLPSIVVGEKEVLIIYRPTSTAKINLNSVLLIDIDKNINHVIGSIEEY